MSALIPISKDRLQPILNAFPYQKEAVEVVQDKIYAAIFHEQGLGKTKIALDVMLHWLDKSYVDTVLIVTKKILVENWMRECKTHCKIKPSILTASREDNYFVFNSPSRIIITNYETLVIEKNRFLLFLKTRDVGIVLDESAKIKNPESGLTKVYHELASSFKRRIIMTGTPVANRPYDIWSQIWFLDQGLSLGSSFAEFKNRYNLPEHIDEDIIDEFERSLDDTWSLIKSFSVREMKSSGIISLPGKNYLTISAYWEINQFEMYEKYKNEMKGTIVKNGNIIEDNAEVILKRLLRLIQIASNPILVDNDYEGTPGKLDVLRTLVNKIMYKKEKCIIWTSFTENVDYLTKYFKQFGAVKVHGRMTIDDRNKSITKFINDVETKIFIATPAAAKEGLTLTVANHSIFFDRTFSLDDYLQAQDRIHRISQKKECYIYKIIMENSIDLWIDILLHSKETAAHLMQGDTSLDEYQKTMDYTFTDVLHQILNMT